MGPTSGRVATYFETRERLSATIEAALLESGREAVAEGRAEGLSAWVNGALRRQRINIDG